MIDGVSFKEFLTNDGVQYPVVSNTTYPITYISTGTSTNTLDCFRIEYFSDGTQYTSITPQLKTQLSNKPTISGNTRRQYSVQNVTEIDIYGQPQTIFPYIVYNNAGPTWAYGSGQTETQTWSDGRTYSYTYP